MAKRKQEEPVVKKIISSIIWLGTLPLCLYTLLTYLLSYSLVIDHWLAGFLMMTLPYAQLLCFFSLVYWVFRRAKRALLPLIVLALGYSFIQRSLSWNTPVKSPKSAIRVMSYNVYGMYSNSFEANKDKVKALKKFMLD
jgi:hypothetical protein